MDAVILFQTGIDFNSQPQHVSILLYVGITLGVGNPFNEIIVKSKLVPINQ